MVIGDKKMAVFDDAEPNEKLRIFDKGIEWREGKPVARNTSEAAIDLEDTEPLHIECQHFLECIQTGSQPLTDGESALRVLRVLEASQLSMEQGGAPVSLAKIN